MFTILILSIVCECLTEFLVKDSILDSLRIWLIQIISKVNQKLANFVAELISCGRCASAWVSFALCLCVNLFQFLNLIGSIKFMGNSVLIGQIVFYFFLQWMLTWRTSNLFHFLMDKARGNRIVNSN